MIVSPSFLSADFLHLSHDIEVFNASDAQWLHYDVMDGNFVPNISFGPSILKQIASQSDKFMDVHIMVSNPLKAIDYFDGCRVDMLTFHVEALESMADAKEVIDAIHAKGIKAGISVKPKTDVRILEEVLPYVDLVLIMSVEPGFGGQKFMADMMEKGDWLYAQKQANGYDYYMEIDGGINEETAKVAKAHHFEVLVAGSYCFKHPKGFDFAVRSLLEE